MDDEDDDSHQTPDDALEPAGQTFHPAVDEEKLEGDYDTPAAPPARNLHHIPPNHPVRDAEIDQDELYSQGIGEASDMDENQILPGEQPKPLEPEE